MDSGGVDDMFSSLGWSQFENIDSALEFLTKSTKKKKVKTDKTKKSKPKESTSTKKNKNGTSSIDKSVKESLEGTSSSPSNYLSSLSSTHAAATKATDLKGLLPRNDAILEKDYEKINSGTSTVVEDELFNKENDENAQEASVEKSSVLPQVKKEDSFEVNSSLGHRLSSNNTLSDLSVSDDSVANITSGICKKIQFNSDDSSLLDSKLLEKSASCSNNSSLIGKSSPEGGKSSPEEKNASVFSTSSEDRDNHHIRTSDQFSLSDRLLETENLKKEKGCASAYLLLSDDDDDDDDDDDLDGFIQKMLTPNKTSVDDSTSRRSVISDFPKREKNSEDAFSDSSSSEKENNTFAETSSHKKNNDGRGRDTKRNVCSPSIEIPKQNANNWAMRNKNAISYSTTPTSESCGSSSDEDDDFEAFLEKMQKTNKETPQWSPESMKTFIVSSSDESNEEEECLSLYHRIRPISPDIDKSLLFGRPATSYIPKSSNHEKRNINDDKENRTKDKTRSPYFTPKEKPAKDIFKKPSNNFPLTEIKKPPPATKPSQLPLSEVTPQKTGLLDLKKNNWTCPNLKSSDSLQKVRSNKPAEGNASFLKSLSVGVPIDSIDPNARKYVKHFKQYQDDLVSKLFKIYNETVFDSLFPADFSIRFNKRLLTTAGHCILKTKYTNNRNDYKRSAEICLATKVCDTTERVRDTLIHEMCHAAVWVFNGSREGHGRLWKTWAWKANRVHPYLPLIKRCHSYDIAKKYTYKCQKCGYSFGRHSKSLDTTKKVCGYCKGQFEVFLSSSQNGTPTSTPTPTRTPSKFALFVKEHYGTTKKLEKCSHKEVMQKLSAQFKLAQI